MLPVQQRAVSVLHHILSVLNGNGLQIGSELAGLDVHATVCTTDVQQHGCPLLMQRHQGIEVRLPASGHQSTSPCTRALKCVSLCQGIKVRLPAPKHHSTSLCTKASKYVSLHQGIKARLPAPGHRTASPCIRASKNISLHQTDEGKGTMEQPHLRLPAPDR